MSDLLQDKTVLLGVCVTGAAVLAAVTYIFFGPEVWRGRIPRCTGLINLGNTCFINAILQGLAALPAVSEWLKYCETYWQGKLIFALHSLLHELNSGEQLELAPNELLDALMRHGWVIDHQQQDALELYHVLLSTIDEEMTGSTISLSDLHQLVSLAKDSTLERSKQLVLTRMGHTLPPSRPPACPLRGLLTSTLVCCQCKHSLPTRYEYFDSLSLPLKQPLMSKISLDYCLQGYMHSELVSNVDCTFCTRNCSTKEKRNFVKQLLIGRLPPCLTLHIMRTVWLPDGLLSKNHTHMEFPLSLDLTKFTAHTDRNSRIYNLQAVVEHLGGPESGHYCTYRRHGSQWICTSDTAVYPVSRTEVLQCQAYMLMYQRT